MAEEDKNIRKACGRGVAAWEEVADADRRHADALGALVSQVGWRRIARTGRSTMNAAWLLVQHATHDVAFQKACLMEWNEIPDVPRWQVAYLQDRVALFEGRAQTYGSQLQRRRSGAWRLWPTTVSTLWELDDARASVGLQPFAEQWRLITGDALPHGATLAALVDPHEARAA